MVWFNQISYHVDSIDIRQNFRLIHRGVTFHSKSFGLTAKEKKGIVAQYWSRKQLTGGSFLRLACLAVQFHMRDRIAIWSFILICV